MGIPRIASYPLPTPEDIPAARVPWTPDPHRAAILVHDMQQYFIAAFEPGSAPIAPMTDNIARLLQRGRELGMPVFYTAQRGNQERRDRGLQADFWGGGMQAAAEHEKIIDALVPQSGDIQLVKHRYSAFQRSNLLPLMQARGRDQLIICGVYAQIGCMLTAAEAFQHDIEAFLVADAVAAYSRENHDLAVNYVSHCCGVSMTTERVLEHLHGNATDTQEGDTLILTLEQMRADIAEMIHESPDEVRLDDNLMDLGLDSMRVMSLLERWGRQGVDLDFSRIAERLTLAGWWELAQIAQGREPAAPGVR